MTAGSEVHPWDRGDEGGGLGDAGGDFGAHWAGGRAYELRGDGARQAEAGRCLLLLSCVGRPPAGRWVVERGAELTPGWAPVRSRVMRGPLPFGAGASGHRAFGGSYPPRRCAAAVLGWVEGGAIVWCEGVRATWVGGRGGRVGGNERVRLVEREPADMLRGDMRERKKRLMGGEGGETRGRCLVGLGGGRVGIVEMAKAEQAVLSAVGRHGRNGARGEWDISGSCGFS